MLFNIEEIFHLEIKRLILVNFVNMVLITSHFNYLPKCEIKIILEGCIQSPLCTYLYKNDKENSAHVDEIVVQNEGKRSLHNLLIY